MRINRKQLLLIILMLVSTQFFGLVVLLPFNSIINAVCVTFFGVFFFSQVGKLKTFTEGKLLCLYFLFLIFSCIYSIVFNGQSPVSMYHGIVNYMGLMTFAYCYKNHMTYNEVNKVLFFVSIVFCICYVIQWIIYPTSLFVGATVDSFTEDYFRMRLPSSLGAFYVFLRGVKCIIKQNYSKAVACIVLGGIPIIIMGFRTLTFLTILASLLLFLQYSKHNLKTLQSVLFIVVAAVAISQTSLFNNKLDEMLQRQESQQVFSNKDYIRWIEMDYYVGFFDKPGEWLIGGGVPCGTSRYALKIQDSLEQGLYWQDLGLVGLSFIIGIITVCILVFWSLRMMVRCGHLDLGVERMTMFIALFGSIMTTMEYFRPGNFMVLGLLFYSEYIRNLNHDILVKQLHFGRAKLIPGPKR